MTAGAGDFPALGPSLAETLARFSLGTRKINFLASAQCRLIRIWHDHPFVRRRGGPGPRAAPRCPGDAHGDMPGPECVPGRARVPALCWQGCGMLTCREQNCSEGRGGLGLLGFGLFYNQCQQPPRALHSPGYCCHLPVPWVILGCQPQSRAEGEAVPHVSHAGLSPGQPDGYTGSAPEEAAEPPRLGSSAGLWSRGRDSDLQGQRPCPVLLPPREMLSWLTGHPLWVVLLLPVWVLLLNTTGGCRVLSKMFSLLDFAFWRGGRG